MNDNFRVIENVHGNQHKRFPCCLFGLFSSLRVWWFAVILAASCSNETAAVQEQKDSSTRFSDSIHINSLLDKAWDFQATNPDSSFIYARQALLLAEDAGILTSIAEAECRIGNSDEYKGNYADALVHYLKAESLDSLAGYQHGIARDCYQQAIAQKRLGHYEQAMFACDRAILIWDQLKNKQVQLAQAYITRGNIYLRQGFMNEALISFQNSLDISRMTKNNQLKADATNSIGLVYEKQHQFQRALDMYNQSLTIEENRNNPKGIAIASSNIGNIWFYQGDFTKAKGWYKKSILIKEKLHQEGTIAGTLTNLGLIYEGLGNLDSARFYHYQSLQLQEKNEDQQGIAITANNLGTILRKQGKADQSIQHYEKSLRVARAIGAKMIEMDVLKNLSEVYAEKHNYSKAFEFGQLYQSIRDSAEEYMMKATEIDVSYQKEQNQRQLLEKEQQKQLAELEKGREENRRKTTMLYSLVVVVLLLMLLFFVYWRMNLKTQKAQFAEQQEKIKRQQTEELIRNQELSFLHSMMEAQEKERRRIAQDLHDRLGLKLATAKIYYDLVARHINEFSLEEKQQYQNGNLIIDEACTELRKVAHNLVSGELMRFGLVQALERLCKTITEIGGVQIDFYSSGMDDRLDSQSELQLYQVVQELLTNVLRHAASTKVTVQLSRYNHTLNLLIEDNGKGFQQHDTRGEGIGLRNIRERIHNLNGTFVLDSTAGKGTTVNIDITVP